MGVLTSDLLEDIKDRSFAPISQNTWTDAKILRLASKEMKDFIVPEIMSVRENFFLAHKDTNITAQVSEITICERAIGNSLKDLFLLDDNSKVLGRLGRASLSRIDAFGDTGSPNAFYLKGDRIRLLPTPDTTTRKLRQYFFLRANDLVETSSCAKITLAVKGASNTTFTVDTDLTASLSAGDKVDFINGQSPYLLHAYDSVIVTITSTTIIVANADVVDGAGSVMPGVDDYICPRLQANIPMLPEEYHTPLAIKTAKSMISSLGDMKKYQILDNDLKTSLAHASKLIANRVESQPQKINPRNSILGVTAGQSYLLGSRSIIGNA